VILWNNLANGKAEEGGQTKGWSREDLKSFRT